MSDISKFRNLRMWNAVLAVLHLTQGIALIVLSNDFKVPISTTFLSGDGFQTGTETLMEIPVGPLVGIFLLISAAAHSLMASPLYYNRYVSNLKKHINYVRWYEYALSASLMVVIIGLLSGVFDAPSMIMLFSLTAAMNLFGLMMELYNQKRETVSWTAFWFGTFAGIIPWIVIAWYFFGALANADDSVPKFVYAILPTLFVFFSCFAINMVFQYKKVWKWKEMAGRNNSNYLYICRRAANAAW